MLISDLKKQRRKNDFAPNRINSHKSNRAGQIKKKCALITWWRRRIFFPFLLRKLLFFSLAIWQSAFGRGIQVFISSCPLLPRGAYNQFGHGLRRRWRRYVSAHLARSQEKKKPVKKRKLTTLPSLFPPFFFFFPMSAPDFDSEECVNQVPIDSFHLVLRFSRVWCGQGKIFFFQGKDLGVLAKCLSFLQCEKKPCFGFVSE